MSGSIGLTPANLRALSTMKIMAFVGSDDTIVLPEKTTNFIDRLNVGGNTNAQYIVLDGADHFAVPSRAYLNRSYGVLRYLLQNSR